MHREQQPRIAAIRSGSIGCAQSMHVRSIASLRGANAAARRR
jgi:hypothetical protein